MSKRKKCKKCACREQTATFMRVLDLEAALRRISLGGIDIEKAIQIADEALTTK